MVGASVSEVSHLQDLGGNVENGLEKCSSLSPNPPRKTQWQERMVYSTDQRQELEKFFKSNRYASYEERETLAARLNLQKHQVQVWLKNRRAKDGRLQRLHRQQGPGAPATPQEPGVCTPQPAPAPAPAPAGPVFSQVPVFSQGPDFCSRPLHSPFASLPSSRSQRLQLQPDLVGPCTGRPEHGPAAPAPAPARAEPSVWPQGPKAIVTPDFTELCSP